jgi:hypothetical protein
MKNICSTVIGVVGEAKTGVPHPVGHVVPAKCASLLGTNYQTSAEGIQKLELILQSFCIRKGVQSSSQH